MSEIASHIAPPLPGAADKLKFYGIWVVAAVALLLLPQIFTSGGSLTTFSIANDVAKYFAIIPAAFAVTYPQLNRLNVMGLHSPNSAILSAVIFNALIIVFLIPLALKGVSYKPMSAAALLRRNLWIYGVGGLAVPFAGIKVIDMLLTVAGLA